VFKHAMPSCAQPAVLPTDPNCSSALRDSTAVYKKSSMTLFEQNFDLAMLKNEG